MPHHSVIVLSVSHLHSPTRATLFIRHIVSSTVHSSTLHPRRIHSISTAHPRSATTHSFVHSSFSIPLHGHPTPERSDAHPPRILGSAANGPDWINRHPLSARPSGHRVTVVHDETQPPCVGPPQSSSEAKATVTFLATSGESR